MADKSAFNKAWDDGYGTFCDGQELQSNPYHDNGKDENDLAYAWEDGFKTGEGWWE